jgi:fatty acid desaturase
MSGFQTGFHTGRSGDEPLHARSPLRLRLGLAGVGLACAIAGIVVFVLVHVPSMVGIFAALAVIALVDAAVVMRHLNSGARYQPGPEVPPYEPSHADAPPPGPPPDVPVARRHARFVWAALVALVLVINAWAWVWRLSPPWAVVVSAVAAVLLLAGVVASNTGSAVLQGNSVPGTEGETEHKHEHERTTTAATRSRLP